MSIPPRPAPQIRMERLARLEECATDLFDAAKALSQAIGEQQAEGLTVTIETVEKVNRAKAAVDNLINKRIRVVNRLYVMAPTIDALQKANDLVLADNACTLGRDGCEKRWDAAMAALRKSLRRFNFDTPPGSSGGSS